MISVLRLSLCYVVCAHLAAHRENVEGRNGDFAKIIQQTLFLEKGANDVASGVDTTDAIRKYGRGTFFRFL